jgi:hypothetical protein
VPGLTAACCILAVQMATTPDDLAEWWRGHQVALRGLSRDDLASVVVAKDARKVEIAG